MPDAQVDSGAMLKGEPKKTDGECYDLFQAGFKVMQSSAWFEAAELFRRSQVLKPYTGTVAREGECLLEAGEHLKALICFEVAFGYDRKFYRAICLKARALIGLGRLAEADDALALAKRLNPEGRLADEVRHLLGPVPRAKKRRR